MISITNQHRGDLEFATGVRGGATTFTTVKAGETRNVDVSADDRTVVARVNAGMITVGDARRGRQPGAASSETSGS